MGNYHQNKPLNWFLGVSFKEELLSEYLIQHGYRYTGSIGVPVSLQFRKYVDNDLCGVREDYDGYADEIRKDYRKLLPHLFEVIKKAAEKFVIFSKSLKKEELAQGSNQELHKKFQQFCELYEQVAGPGLPVGFIGEMVMVPVLQEKITPFLQEKGISFSEFTNIISFPSKITLVAQERRDILTIASQIGNFNQYRKFFEEHTPQESIIFLQEHDKKILQDIEEHSKKYIWILKMLLAGDNYTAEKVIERLQVMICNNPQQKLTEMAIKMENQLDNLHQLCNEFPLEIQNDIVLFQEVLYFREVRLMWINEGCHYSALLLEEIAQRLDLTYEEVIYLLPDEIENGLNNQFKVPQEEIQKRLDKYAMILENNQITLYTGDEVEKHRVKSNVKNFNDVQGYPASQGKVQGIVRLVKDRSELHKVQKGDILVTKLTTPDFVVAMEKAAAIVTDLGGITSHAAIVSRELGVPCIVGTEVATQVFKDGDKVDVDAFTGIVRKIIGED